MIGAAVEKGAAEVDGLSIAYESVGAGAPAVMFVHGIFGNRGYFADQARHLAPHHRVITLDLRAHGESDPVSSVSVEDVERDVIAVLEASNAGPAVVCGHSVLGSVALTVAARRPDLVRAVVMLDAVIFFPEAVRQAALESLLPALRGDHWLDATRAYLARLIDPAAPDVVARLDADIRLARREIALSFFESVFGSQYPVRQQLYREALGLVRCPLMYVHAKAPADLALLQTLKPDAMVGQVVGSGHYLMLSAADQLNAMLDRFLMQFGQRP